MPMRPKKPLTALTSAVPYLEPLNPCSDNQPLPSSPTPPVLGSSPAPQRVNTSQRPVSLVIRNARSSRNKPFHPFIPKSNHYLLAKSLVENDQPSKRLSSERKPSASHMISPSPLGGEVPPPDFVFSDFVWLFSPSYPDPQIQDTLTALKFYDPQTFAELVTGLD